MACKLVYVNSRGRAELIRFILAQAEVPYEDSRINLAELQEARDGMRKVFHNAHIAMVELVFIC